MIDRIVAALRAVDENLDWRDVADVLHLLAATHPRSGQEDSRTDGDDDVTPSDENHQRPKTDTRPEETKRTVRNTAPRSQDDTVRLRHAHPATAGARTVGLRSSTRDALPRQLEIARAVRPLRQRRPARHEHVLDIDATIQHYCDTGLLLPMTEPGKERWFREIALVVDGGPTMVVWQDTTAAFARLLEMLGAADRVSRWTLERVDANAVVVRSPSGSVHDPRELQAYDARRLVLVPTDCVGRIWREPAVWAALRTWGGHGPAALVQMLPERLWPATALGDADVAVSSGRRGAANQQLRLQAPWWWEHEAPLQAAPVLTLDERRLGAWATMLMGTVGVEIAGTMTQDREVSLSESGSLVAGDPNALVTRFRATVSPQAVRLATLLSAVSLSLPVARIVLRELVPDGRQLHLAEVLISGLLRAGDTAESYDFGTGVREVLQAGLTSEDAIAVWRAVTPHLEAERGERAPFSALLETGSVASPGSAAVSDFEIAAAVVERLGLRDLLARFEPPPVVIPDPEPAAEDDWIVPDQPPDLTVHIVDVTLDRVVLRKRWTFQSDLTEVPEGPVVTSHSKQVEDAVAAVSDQFSRARGDGLDAYLAGLGRVVADALPPLFWELFRRVEEAVAPRAATVLFHENSWTVPWDMAMTEPGDKLRARQLLGGRAGIGRWSARPAPEPPTPAPVLRTSPSMAVVGGSYKGARLTPLPGMETEAAGLTAQFGAVRVSPALHSVVSMLQNPEFGVVHLIGHGLGSMKENGIGLNDEEMLEPVLVSGITMPSRPLVFVNTNCGNGLVEALLRADAGGVVAAEWPVDDRVAADFALRFYDLLFRGYVVAEAVRILRLEMTADISAATTASVLGYRFYGQPLLRVAGPVRDTSAPGELGARLNELSAAYNRTRAAMSSGDARTAAMTEIAQEMMAVMGQLDEFDWRGCLVSENRGIRLAAYARLYRKPEPEAVSPLVRTVIGIEDKPFGQYWALRALNRVVETGRVRLGATDEDRLRQYMEGLSPETDRHRELRRLLAPA